MHLNAPSEQILSARPPEFRLFLQEELLRRCKKNPRFSLRAFARTLDVEASALSKILHGKRSLTPKMLHRMCTHLGLGADEVTRYEQTLSAARVARRRPDSAVPLRQVSPDQLGAADWYHDAILKLLTVDGFRPQATWVARVLGISVSEATQAIDRLQRLGLLEIDADGNWHERSGEPATSAQTLSTTAMRKLQRQILQQAMHALDAVPACDREQASVTMAVSKAKLAEARERIRNFRRELCAFLQSDRERHDEVYQLSISLFPVSTAKDASDRVDLASVRAPTEGDLQ